MDSREVLQRIVEEMVEIDGQNSVSIRGTIKGCPQLRACLNHETESMEAFATDLYILMVRNTAKDQAYVLEIRSGLLGLDDKQIAIADISLPNNNLDQPDKNLIETMCTDRGDLNPSTPEGLAVMKILHRFSELAQGVEWGPIKTPEPATS